MMRLRRRLGKRLAAAVTALIMTASILSAAAFSSYDADSDGIEIRVSALAPDRTAVNANDAVRLTFDYQISLQASGTAYFKAGDTVRIDTNFTEMFECDSTFTATVQDYGENELGTLAYDPASGSVVLTVSEAAENMQYHTLSGRFDSFKHFKAKNAETTADYTVTAGVGLAAPAEAPLKITALERQLRVQSSGKGSVSGVTGTISMHQGDEVVIIATPQRSDDSAAPNQVLSASLILSDNTKQAYENPTLPTVHICSYKVDYEDLKPGLNTFIVAFTPDAINSDETAWGFMDYNDVWKNVWGVDYGSYAQNDICIGGAAATNLYASMGKRLGSAAEDRSHELSDLIIEERIPGGAAGKIWGTRLAIEAILPNYWPIKGDSGTVTGYRPFRKEAGRIGDWAGRVYPKGSTDLIAAGLIEKIEQKAADDYDRFLGRIKETPLSYGIFIDPGTQETSILINLGSPGDPDAPGWKCSELWPDQLARDPVLNEINGDANCVNGKVQAFRLWFYTDHSGTRYTTTYENSVFYSATTGAGTAIDRAKRTANYTVTRDSTLGAGYKSTLTVHVVNAQDQSREIDGVDLSLEKWNELDSAWEPAKHEGRTYGGITDESGTLVLGESDGSVETGTLTPGRYRIREVTLPEPYSAKTMTVTAAPSSQGRISPDGEFTVGDSDTKGFVALVTMSRAYDLLYHANGGTGELLCPDNPHPVGTRAEVLTPGDSVTREDYYFVGWNTQPDGSGNWHSPGTGITMPDHDVDLYARWMPNRTSRASFTGTKVWNDAGNASGGRPVLVSGGQPVTLELGNRNGYQFPEGTAAPLPVWSAGDDPNIWTFTYNGLPRFDRAGEPIVWYVTETAPKDYEAAYYNPERPEESIERVYDGGIITNTLTASPYRVEFYYQDRVTGAYPDDPADTAVRKGTVGESCAVTEEDATPDGDHARWAFDAEDQENTLTGTVAMDGSTVLRIFFKAQYSVTYLPGSHGAFEPLVLSGLSYGDPFPAFPGGAGGPAGEEGWDFLGWYLNGKAFGPDARVRSDLTLEAGWKSGEASVPAQRYTITYDLGGGVYRGSTDDVTETYESGARIRILEAPAKEGCTFLYWKGSRYLPGQEYIVRGDHTFTAVWEEDPATPSRGNEDDPGKGNGTPKTGDSRDPSLWATLLGASATILSAMLLRRRRARR